jgi:hypothetical protein
VTDPIDRPWAKESGVHGRREEALFAEADCRSDEVETRRRDVSEVEVTPRGNGRERFFDHRNRREVEATKDAK